MYRGLGQDYNATVTDVFGNIVSGPSGTLFSNTTPVTVGPDGTVTAADISALPDTGAATGPLGMSVTSSPYGPQTTSINPLYLIGGAVGLVLVISLLGGRRR